MGRLIYILFFKPGYDYIHELTIITPSESAWSRYANFHRTLTIMQGKIQKEIKRQRPGGQAAFYTDSRYWSIRPSRNINLQMYACRRMMTVRSSCGSITEYLIYFSLKLLNLIGLRSGEDADIPCHPRLMTSPKIFSETFYTMFKAWIASFNP